MLSLKQLARRLPRPVKNLIRDRLLTSGQRIQLKHDAELDFWKDYVAATGAESEAAYYQKFMTDMGGVTDPRFFDGKVCLDIGCGPRGSLTWLTQAKAAIGLDPLADDYHANFRLDGQPMLYLKCGVEQIPLPSNYVDVVFTMNSLDHVDDPEAACREIRRILKPGGAIIASLNLNEPATVTEPWPLSEDFLHKHLFAGWKREYYEIRPRLNTQGHFGPYRYFYEPVPKEYTAYDGPMALWCRFTKV